MITVNWATIKQFATDRSLSIQWIDSGGNYYLRAADPAFSLECTLNKSMSVEEVADFETNFKPTGNVQKSSKVLVESMPAFASKTFGTKSLYKRVVGKKYDLILGDTTLLYTETFPWVKFMSIEILGAELGDSCSLYILDTATGTYSGYPNAQLNQFGFDANIAAGFYKHQSEFDADVYQGLQIKIVYTSMSAKTIGINYVMNEVK